MKIRWRHIVAAAAALIFGLLPAGAQINVGSIIEVGRNALYFQDYMLAIRHFNRAIEARPYLAEPYYLRAIAKYSLEDFAGARADAGTALEINPFLPDAWEVRGVANQCLGNFDEAVSDYSRALELLPYNRQILFNKALAQERAEHLAAADSTYATLIEAYPRFDAARVGRAQLRLQQGDTLAARADLTDALALNPNSVEALTLRAMLSADAPASALADMEAAVKLRPDRPDLRVNRAVARYMNNDLNGALNDFDYVLEQEPMNYTALFNRAMLRAELHDNDRALLDLNRALQLRPDDPRARFNRALVLAEKGDHEAALADADAVIAAYPEMYAGYALRAQINRDAGLEAKARADYRRAMTIARRTTPAAADDSEPEEADLASATINRFKALQTVTDDADSRVQTFNAEGLRDRVESQLPQIEPQGIFQLSYYVADGAANGVYDKEIDDLNAARILPYVVFLTNNLPQMTPNEDAARHFDNIQRLNALVEAGRATPLDYFARAMDRMTLKDYRPAIADLDALLAARPDFAPGYLMRAAARFRLMESQHGRVVSGGDAAALNAQMNLTLQQIFADLDKALDYNPAMAAARFNKGVMHMRTGHNDEAIADFNAAIELNPELGAAYYNRGYIEYSQGNRTEAERDLSRAGQLGISAAYRLLKQMQ